MVGDFGLGLMMPSLGCMFDFVVLYVEFVFRWCLMIHSARSWLVVNGGGALAEAASSST